MGEIMGRAGAVLVTALQTGDLERSLEEMKSEAVRATKAAFCPPAEVTAEDDRDDRISKLVEEVRCARFRESELEQEVHRTWEREQRLVLEVTRLQAALSASEKLSDMGGIDKVMGDCY